MEKIKENGTISDEELYYIVYDILVIKDAIENIYSKVNFDKKIKVLPKNNGYFNSVLQVG